MLRPYNSPFRPRFARTSCPRAANVLKQVLRSRAARALAQDDTLTRGLRNLCTTRCVALGVGARGAYTRGHSETRHGDVCLPEPAPRLRVAPSWRPRV